MTAQPILLTPVLTSSKIYEPDLLDDRVRTTDMTSIKDELERRVKVELERRVDAACEAMEAALAPWGGSQACLDAYETSVRATSELHMRVANATQLAPVRTYAAAMANMTRDIGALQLSTARWFLDG